MASSDRKTTHAVAEWLTAMQEKPYAFGFFHVLRLFERLYPQQPRLGTSARPADDPICLPKSLR